ncbi:hypothetical protein [Caenispirillum salinarum]|uniref:hypothetical protein n=1 Tax=Caenispirillum salinarum TaxID=859058 RepID=UPI003850C900
MAFRNTSLKRLAAPFALALSLPLLAACDQPEDANAPPAGGVEQPGAVPGDTTGQNQAIPGTGSASDEPGTASQ